MLVTTMNDGAPGAVTVLRLPASGPDVAAAIDAARRQGGPLVVSVSGDSADADADAIAHAIADTVDATTGPAAPEPGRSSATAAAATVAVRPLTDTVRRPDGRLVDRSALIQLAGPLVVPAALVGRLAGLAPSPSSGEIVRLTAIVEWMTAAGTDVATVPAAGSATPAAGKHASDRDRATVGE